MKNLFLSVAFLLTASFSFAKTQETEKTKLSLTTETSVKTIDISAFKKMVANKEIKIVKGVDFIFFDSCGGVWHVTGGEGWTTAEIMDVLWTWDGGC